MPAFINLQQYYVEEYLVDRAARAPDRIDLRWKNRVTALEQRADGVRLEVETPDGRLQVEADCCSRPTARRSALRDMLGLDFVGRVFEERS